MPRTKEATDELLIEIRDELQKVNKYVRARMIAEELKTKHSIDLDESTIRAAGSLN